MIQQQRNKYLETSVQTATPVQLMIMLWDGAIRFCKLGIDALEKGNYQDANSNLQKAQDIISEFVITLDKSSPIANGLLELYAYFQRRLVDANIKKDVEPAKEVLGYLTELKETWVQAALAAKNANSTPTAGTKYG